MNRLPFALGDMVTELVRAGGKGTGLAIEVPPHDFGVMLSELSEYAPLVGYAPSDGSFEFHGITIRRAG